VQSFLVLRFWLGGVLLRSEGLEAGYLGVQSGEVLFYDKGELVDFDGPVIEYGFLAGDCATLSVRCSVFDLLRHPYVALIFPACPWLL